MSQCLPLVCSSAPDVAYAIEYGESFCKRAGIKNVVIQLPISYLEGANGTYFTWVHWCFCSDGREIAKKCLVIADQKGISNLGRSANFLLTKRWWERLSWARFPFLSCEMLAICVSYYTIMYSTMARDSVWWHRRVMSVCHTWGLWVLEFWSYYRCFCRNNQCI